MVITILNIFVWEQQKLGTYIIEYKKKTTKNNEYPVLTSSRKGIFFQKDYYDGHQVASKDNVGYNIVPYGYLTYRHMSDDNLFKFNINTLCKFGIVSTLYPVFTLNTSADKYFVYYYLNYGKEMQKFALIQKQGGSRTYMYLNKLRKLRFIVPLLSEQEKISTTLLLLDKLISLQQRKLDLLKQLKKGLLQKMFANKNNKQPALRFEDFHGDWEKSKIETLLNYEQPDKYIVKTTNYVDSGVPVLTANKSFVLGYSLENNRYNNLPAIIFDDFTLENKFVNFPFLVKSSAIKILTAKKPYSLGFIYELLQRTHFIHEGHTRHYISIVQKTKVMVPSVLKEQNNISEIFQNIQKVITLQQKKLTKLQSTKKFLLQNLFI